MRFLTALFFIGLCLPVYAGELESKYYDPYLDSGGDELHDLNFKDVVGETALHRAAASGDVKAIRELIADGAQTTPYDIDGQSPIYYAIASGEYDTAYYLIQYVEDFYSDKDVFGRAVYDFAVELADDNFIDNLTGGYELFHIYMDGNDASRSLQKALSSGRIDVLRYVVNFIKLDPFYVDQYQNSLLHMAAQSGNIELVNYIISLFDGATPLFTNIIGQTPLHIAVEHGFTEAINPIAEVNLDQLFVFSDFYAPTSTPFKLAKNSDNEEIESKLRSLLHDFYEVEDKFNNVRAMMAYSEIFQDSKDGASQDLFDAINSGIDVAPYYYLNAGADLSELSILSDYSDKATAFHIAARYKKLDLIAAMAGQFKGNINLLSGNNYNVFSFLIEAGGSIEEINKLIDLGADPNLGNNPMEQAINVNDMEILNLLIAKGVSVHRSGAKNSSILLIAAKENNLEAVSHLLALGADPLYANLEGDTALHLAAEYASMELFQVLAEKAKSFDLKNNDNNTPLDIAIYQDRSDIIAYLLENSYDLGTSFRRFELALHHGMIDLAQALFEIGDYNLDTVLYGSGWVFLHGLVSDYQRTDDLIEEFRGESRDNLIKAMTFLADHGATIDFQDNSGETPLHLAVKHDLYPVTELLLKLGANPEVKAGRKNAVKFAQSKRIYMLLKDHGANGKRFFLK